jgi:hypothetical protein
MVEHGRTRASVVVSLSEAMQTRALACLWKKEAAEFDVESELC